MSKSRILLKATVVAFAAVWASACSVDWPAFRHDNLRTGGQPNNGPLADPTQVPNLAVQWRFPSSALTTLNPAPGAFYAAPIVYNGVVYVGNSNGYFYAIDATTGALKWQYPAPGQQALTSTFTCNPSSMGIADSASIMSYSGGTAVVFGAPDQSIGTGLGSGRLFALDAGTGAVVWKSPEIAMLRSDGVTHQQIGYSSPLVSGSDVYVGIADHCDDPIQRGKIVAVHLSDGSIDTGFSFVSTGPPIGGGIWGSVAAWIDSLYVVTGNVNEGNPEPVPNHGLSMSRIDPSSGAIIWTWQPVPYALDADPDWTSTPSIVLASCGALSVSAQKDGWAWAMNVGNGTPGPASVAWAFPTGPWVTNGFQTGDGTTHNDTDYNRPGAAWGDVYIVQTGGLDVTSDVLEGFNHLYALNACASDANRVRWIADLPMAGGEPSSPPTVTRGIVYIGTQTGHLLAIGDPSIVPADGVRCEDPDVSSALCILNGFSLVDQPHVLKDIDLAAVNISTEPVLASNRLFVSTWSGEVVMLSVP